MPIDTSINKIPLQKKWLETKTGRIYYFLDQSFPSRPTVVFLHGLSANHTTWLDIIKDLHNNQFNSLAVDLRGHGFSDKAKNKSLYELAVFSEDLRQMVRQEKLGQFFLVGYSFGGSIAIDYATCNNHQLKGLILISANYASPLNHLKLKFLNPLAIGLANLLALLLLWQKRKEYIYFQQGASKGYWHSVWLGLNTMPLSINLWMMIVVGRLNFKNRLSRVRCPALIVRAKHDPFLSAAEEIGRASCRERV